MSSGARAVCTYARGGCLETLSYAPGRRRSSGPGHELTPRFRGEDSSRRTKPHGRLSPTGSIWIGLTRPSKSRIKQRPGWNPTSMSCSCSSSSSSRSRRNAARASPSSSTRKQNAAPIESVCSPRTCADSSGVTFSDRPRRGRSGSRAEASSTPSTAWRCAWAPASPGHVDREQPQHLQAHALLGGGRGTWRSQAELRNPKDRDRGRPGVRRRPIRRAEAQPRQAHGRAGGELEPRLARVLVPARELCRDLAAASGRPAGHRLHGPPDLPLPRGRNRVGQEARQEPAGELGPRVLGPDAQRIEHAAVAAAGRQLHDLRVLGDARQALEVVVAPRVDVVDPRSGQERLVHDQLHTARLGRARCPCHQDRRCTIGAHALRGIEQDRATGSVERVAM